MQELYSNLLTIRNIWANSYRLNHILGNWNSFIQTWVQLEPSR